MCFVQSVKRDKLSFRALVWKCTWNSYNISSFWICSIKVDKCLRTYYNLSWKYVNTAKIISKVTIMLSLNKDFDFVGWVSIETPCEFYFRSVKFHFVKETQDINNLLTLVKIVLASQHKKPHKQIFVKICWNTDLKVHALHWAIELLVLAFQNLLQTRQTSRNNKKLSKKGFWLWLLIL